MSAPPRNARGGTLSRARSGNPAAHRSRGRGATVARGGRGREGANTSTNARAENLLHGLQSGNLNQRPGTLRRGSGQTPVHSQPSSTPTRQANPGLSSTPSTTPSNQRDYLNQMTAKFQRLKTEREAERAEAIRDGFLADPDKKTSLDKAITPAGTCIEMCPEFERVERIVQNMVDKAEKVPDDESGRDVPAEERMVKRFRRSAAGYDEQLPSDIRTPETLQKTLDYLLDNIVGGEERLASVHKFVWDRTRGIRNDFSIQQVTKGEDVRIAVDCFERIARFHIISLHQLSNPENHFGEHFDAHQEREQLNNTLLSLMYYYDDNRRRQQFENEAEFRAYCIIFELQSQQPDLEDRMQSWPQELLQDPRIRTAFRLYSAAGNTLYDQGPLKPQAAFDIAQGNAGGFWHLLKSKAVTYLMACVAEIYFGQVRFMALQGLWKSVKRAPAGMQSRLQDWTLQELTKLLGFDDGEQALQFCREYNLDFRSSDAGERYLDFTSQPEMTLDRSSTPNKQVFSFGMVEEKRYHRTLVAVINGVGVAQAIRERLVVEQQEIEDDQAEEDTEADDDSSLFLPETKKPGGNFGKRRSGSTFNPQAPAFIPVPSTPKSLPSPSSSSAEIKATEVESHVAAPAFHWSRGASEPLSASVFGNDAQLQGSVQTQSNTSQTRSSVFSSAAATEVASASSFGMPSFLPSAPPYSTWSAAPSAVNNNRPSTVFNRVSNNGKPGDDPEFMSAPNLHVGPPNDPAPAPVTGKNNIQSTKPDSGAPLVDKPPSSPRPGFRSLPTATIKEQEQPLLQDASPKATQSLVGQQNSGNTWRSETDAAGSQASNSPEALIPASTILPATSSSSPIDQYISHNNLDQPNNAESPQLSTSISTSQPPKQQFPSRTASPPPINPAKSAIPPTFTPNVSPSFTSSASTKPKHKSPLGSQPPIFAVDSTAKPPSPQQAAADLNKAASNLATIGFFEPHGILQQYIEHSATALIEDALRQFEREEPLRAAQSLRYRLLSQKYFTRWSSICWRRKLNRNAMSRREHLARSILQESQRKARSDTELEAILEAQKQKAMVQAEQLQLRRNQDPRPRFPVPEVSSSREETSLAGHKRKSLHGDELNPTVNDVTSRKVAKAHGHRRSRTVEATSDTSKDNFFDHTAMSPPRTRVNSSALSGRSVLLDDFNGSVLRRSTSGRKTDLTHTDYFRLKALGVDPDTPFVPDTKFSLERKRRHQAVVSLPTPRKRASTLSSVKAGTSAPNETGSTSRTQAHSNSAAPGTSRSVPDAIRSDTSCEPEKDDDDFLQQIRKVRMALSEDTEWFRLQAAQIEKEVDQCEELLSSQPQPNGRDSPAIAASDSNRDLARVNGYDYAPLTPRSSSQLSQSRTEQRIRATGAHGLATKPVSDYLPVAMSKLSGTALTNIKGQSRLRKRKGRNKRREKDSRYIYKSDGDDDNRIEERERLSTTGQRERHANHKRHLTNSDCGSEAYGDKGQIESIRVNRAAASYRVNAYHHRSFNLGDGFHDQAGEDEIIEQEDEENDEENLAYCSSNGTSDGDQGEGEAEGDEAEEFTGDENQSEAEPTLSTYGRGRQKAQTLPKNPFHMKLRSATPEAHPSPGQEYALGGTQMSRATSGTGISADDALILSD